MAVWYYADDMVVVHVLSLHNLNPNLNHLIYPSNPAAVTVSATLERLQYIILEPTKSNARGVSVFCNSTIYMYIELEWDWDRSYSAFFDHKIRRIRISPRGGVLE